ncbi:anaphase-promoting complex subunit 1 [Trichonephila clavata]|uniref:Anaphase-promoting complex subunit 1 n=1 Tax=Trichonephila clavata TaxID=2740835 RepID=A0A8X6F7Z9_TRICU|nr:anaphase-promoting complex subunit 1 [Trichonephila clavata]
MITAGEPQEFIPLGREHLKVHPGDVYLSIENVPAAPAANDHSLTRDLLKALRGVSLKDQAEEHWFLKENINDDAEEEFYWNGKTVIWSKSSGHGVKKVQKSFTMENNVLQVLWTEFRIRSCKPRIMDAVIEMETENHEALCGVCVVENSAVSVFATNGEDYIVSTPFEVLRAWTSRYGIIFERNLAVEKKENVSKQNQVDDLPVIFSMMHPLDDIAPVIKRRISANIVHINYFCDSSEDIVFCCSDPSLVMTYNKKGFHSIWKLRTTTFQEADYACSKIQMTTPIKTNNTSAVSASKSSKSKLNISTQTPSLNASSPYHSYHSSRVASPASMQGRSFSPGVSHLTHMATLSRSQPPSLTNSLSHPHGFTPLSAPSRSSFSASQETDVCKFMEPLAPDICFDHEWSTDLSCIGHQEKASKVFLSKDITGHSYLCYFLKEQQSLQLIKFEENKSTKQWIFGSISSISTLDAEALPDLDLIITVDANFTLTLYTGTVKICKVHVADIFGPINDVLTLSNPLPPISYTTPKRTSFIASTRPPSATSTKFGDESQILSPVPMIIEEPIKSVLNEEMSFFQVGPIKGIRDSVRSRVTLETSAGYYRLQIPEITVSKTVSKCLKALKYALPRDIYTQVFIKWYSSRNAPGPNDMDTRSELNVFLLSLLGLIGFDNDRIVLGDCIKSHSNVPAQVKKLKTHEKGCDDDWYHIMSLNNHKQNVEFKFLNEASIQYSPVEDICLFNDSALLFPYIAHVLFAIHLVYEDCKLDITLWNDLCQMCSFLCELARELRQYKYLDHYWQDFPEQFKSVNKHFIISEVDIQKVLYPSYFAAPPSIYHYINTCLTSSIAEPFPYIPNVTRMLHGIVLVFAVLTSLENPVFRIKDYLSDVTGLGVKEDEVVNDSLLSSCYSISYNPKKAAVYLITKLGFTIKDINSLPIGLALPIKDALLNCWHEPSGLWSKDMFDLIGRRDLSSLQTPEKVKVLPQPTKSKHEHGKNSSKDNFEDGLHHLDLEVLRLRFDQDHRVHDVFQMLQSSKPVQISLVQRPEVSDHEFIEEQERHLYNLCIRTMAATVGRGMFTLRAYNPVVTEALPIPKLCLTGRAPPRNTTVDLSHIDVPPNMNMWPLFHNGVAAGLSISLSASKIDSTWMVYNKPRSSSSDTPTEHAGFLMALGLNGHLSRLSTLSIHDYLCKGHELTSVGILLGVSAAKRGTMDLSATKLLSIHIEALLPPTSTELDVAPAVQVAAVMGLGLLYQGSGHHHMAEVLLGEIGRPPGPEMEHSIDRESYSLAAGLALGLITLGKGKEMSGVADFPMADQLYHYMVGGHKRPLTGIHKEKHKSPSYQIREGDNVNVDVTSPGATLALGMMFFNTDNHAIADWMTAPDTQFLLDMVRPDFLLLRTVSKGLILWTSIHPSVKWIESHLPDIVSKHAFQRGVTNADVDYETMSQAYCNIIAGGCFCLGLKFAGSANAEAFETLMQYAKHFLSLSRKHVGDQAGEQAGRSTIETCLNVVVLSLAMVMAGTGDLDVIRICRHLRSRISQAASYVLYGSHMVTHMALGLLFLGGGRFTLSTTPLSIGAMICAFFPKFPQHSNDNRYHLQAFYHLYVLAVEPRLIVPRLIDSNKPVYINIKVTFKDTPYYENAEFAVKAPCILPELKFLKRVVIEDPRYWPIVFDCDENWDVLRNLLENGGTLHVMQNAGCLPYSEDPQGFRSLLAQSYIWNNVHAWNIKNVQISDFSSDPVALKFASCFLSPPSSAEEEKEWQQKICGFLFECASLEKMEALPICVSMIQMAKLGNFNGHTFDLWQIKMVSAYENWIKRYSSCYKDTLMLLRPDFGFSVSSVVERSIKKASIGLKNHLLQYITQNWTPVNNTLPDYPSALVGFILLHDLKGVNSPNLQSIGEVNLPALYDHLRNFNLSTSSVMSVLSVLSS